MPTKREQLFGTVLKLGLTDPSIVEHFRALGLKSSDFHTQKEKALFKELTNGAKDINSIQIKLIEQLDDLGYSRWEQKLDEGVPKQMDCLPYMQKLAQEIILERLTRKLFEQNKNFEDHIKKTGNFNFPNWDKHRAIVDEIDRVQSPGGFAPILLQEAERKELQWLWLDRLPLNKLCMISGDPDSGKSLFCLWLCSMVTRGHDWPDGSAFSQDLKGSVLYVNAEDTLEDTIAPRAEAMGVDLSKVYFKSRFNLETEILELRNFISSHPDLRLILIDNIDSYLQIQTNEAVSVYESLLKLSEICQEQEITAIFTRHLNKDESKKILYRTTGSVAWVGVVRAAWCIQKDEEDAQNPWRYVAKIKGNLGIPCKNLKFKIQGQRGSPILAEMQEVEESAEYIMGDEETRDKLQGSALAELLIIEMIVVRKKNEKKELEEEIVEKGHCSESSFYRALKKMKKNRGLYGKFDSHQNYRYFLPK